MSRTVAASCLLALALALMGCVGAGASTPIPSAIPVPMPTPTLPLASAIPLPEPTPTLPPRWTPQPTPTLSLADALLPVIRDDFTLDRFAAWIASTEGAGVNAPWCDPGRTEYTPAMVRGPAIEAGLVQETCRGVGDTDVRLVADGFDGPLRLVEIDIVPHYIGGSPWADACRIIGGVAQGEEAQGLLWAVAVHEFGSGVDWTFEGPDYAIEASVIGRVWHVEITGR